MLGDDLSLSTEYCNAVLRAAILEGEVYILTIERGAKREIATWAVFFPPGCALFGTQVSCAFVNSFQTNPNHSAVKLNGNWDLTNSSKNSNPKYKIGIQILYVSPPCYI
jgi:hypothetical protein